MFEPPSLPDEVRSRAFRATNGELGICLEDVPAFLAACEHDQVTLVGWDLWLIDHAADPEAGAPCRQPGAWCGFIPTVDHATPAVIGGSGDLASARRQIASLDLSLLVAERWRPHLRVNFTLDA